MKKKTQSEAIRDRDQLLKLMQMELQTKIAEFEVQLTELNSQINGVAFDSTGEMIYEILQDRAKEIAFGNKVHRY